MNPGKLAIRLEKRWIMRDSLIQQIGGLAANAAFPLAARAPGQNKIFGAAIKIEGGEIGGWRALDG